MNAERTEIKVRRVSSRKRSRESLKTHLTPARKRGGGGGGDSRSQQCPQHGSLSSIMADIQAAEVSDRQHLCSRAETMNLHAPDKGHVIKSLDHI